MRQPLAALLSLTLVLGPEACAHRRNNSAVDAEQLQVYAAIHDFDTEAGARTGLFDGDKTLGNFIDTKFKGAATALQTARGLRDDDAKARLNDGNSSYVSPSQSATNPLLGNIPTAAADQLVMAASAYKVAQNLFDIGRPSVDYDDLVDNKQCGDTPLYPEEYGLCRKILLAAKLYGFATTNLQNYLTSASTGQISPVALQRYLQEYSGADAVVGKINSMRNAAYAHWMAVNEGSLDPVDVTSVPYLSVIGSPTAIKDRLTDALAQYVGKVGDVVKDRIAAQNAASNVISQQDRINELKTQLIAIQGQTDITTKDQQASQADFDFNQAEYNRIALEIENNTRKFSTEMRNVMGEPGTSALLTTRTLQTAADGSLSADIDISSSVMAGPLILDVSAAATGIKANGIYYQNLPAGALNGIATGWGGGGFINKVAHVASNAVQSTTNAVQSVAGGSIPGLPSGAGGAGLLSGLLGSQTGPLAGLLGGGAMPGGLGGLLMGGAQPGTPDPMALIQQGLKTVGTAGATLAGSLLPAGHPQADPIGMANNMAAGLSSLKYPQLPSHVFLQQTTVNGYVISRSIGSNVGATTGTSASTSTGSSIGVSLGVNFVVTATGSVGMSKGIDEGTSSGASVGASNGLNLQVGFFHPAAKYPLVQVGTLLAEFSCNGAVVATYAVGLANFLTIDNTKCAAGAGSATVHFVINDNIAGAAQNCTDKFPDAAENKCASSTPVPITVRVLQTPDSAYKTLYDLVQSEDIRQAIQDAAYSTDPQGSAWRIFQNKANGKGIADEFVSRFKPVLDQYVALQQDQRALSQLALKMQLDNTKVDEAIRSRTMQQAQGGVLADFLNSGANDADKLRLMQMAFANELVDIDQAYANVYLDRLTKWISVYRASVKYHQNRDVSDPIADLKITMEQLSETAVKSAADGGDVSGQNALTEYANSLTIKKWYSEEDDATWFHNLATQGVVDHCKISLQEMVVGGDRPGTIAPLFNLPGSSPVYPSNLMQPNQGDRVDDNYDINLANSMRFQASDPVWDGYFRIHVVSDPRVDNIAAYHSQVSRPPYVAGNPTIVVHPAMHCAGSAGPTGLSKLLGVAFTYSSYPATSFNANRSVFVQHEPLMFAYVPSSQSTPPTNKVAQNPPAGYRQIYRLIDWSPGAANFLDPNAMAVVQATADPVPLVNLNTASQNGCLTGVSDTWINPSCYQFLLGNNVYPTYGSAGPANFKVNFFNSYLGGSWNIFVPYTTSTGNVWNTFLQNLASLDMHFYFVRYQPVND